MLTSDTLNSLKKTDNYNLKFEDSDIVKIANMEMEELEYFSLAHWQNN